MKKSLTVAEAGKRGGLIGGRSTSPAKVKAAQKNWAKALKAIKRKRALDTKAVS